MYSTGLLALLLAFSSTVSSLNKPRPHDYTTDADLQVFVSRPDIRPPRFHVEVYEPSQVSPGYWFVAPYGDLHNRLASTSFVPGQAGPHIYDGSGELIWSGAHLFGDRATFDFKTASCNGTLCMTFILNENRIQPQFRGGAGMIMDNTFNITDIVYQTLGRGMMNMHEFTITDEDTALLITFKPDLHDVTVETDPDPIESTVGNNGFQEIDMKTREPVFTWWALDHVHPSESMALRPIVPSKTPWDFFHLNSIDKDDNGDYLISSRFLSAIFKISKDDGSVLWQLGGRNNQFTLLDGFNFSSQHDARFRHQNSTHSIISFFNNAADDHRTSASASSGVIVNLDHNTMTASLLERWERPDHELTHLRGNVQLLPNSNEFVCWSENGRISEFNPDGDLLLDAYFTSHRFVTYRAFKLNLTSEPSEAPALKNFVYGTSPKKSTTAMYVSWNGATEVASWRFYGSDSTGKESVKLLGEKRRTGFETVLMVDGCSCQVYAEAISSNGTVLRVSAVEQSALPASWDDAACSSSSGTQHRKKPTDSKEVAGSTNDNQNSLFNISVESSSVFNLMISLCFCILVLLFLLCLAVWKIQKLNKLLKDEYKYEPVAKG